MRGFGYGMVSANISPDGRMETPHVVTYRGTPAYRFSASRYSFGETPVVCLNATHKLFADW